MEEIGITKMSSKGQIVIPLGMRKGMNEGDKFVVMRNKDQLILKRADMFDKNIEEDLEFAKRTENAWKRYQKGEFNSLPADKFLELLEKC